MVGPNFVKTICIFRLLVFLFLSFLFSQLFTIIWKMLQVLQVFKKVINENTGFPVSNVLSFSAKSSMLCN